MPRSSALKGLKARRIIWHSELLKNDRKASVKHVKGEWGSVQWATVTRYIAAGDAQEQQKNVKKHRQGSVEG